MPGYTIQEVEDFNREAPKALKEAREALTVIDTAGTREAASTAILKLETAVSRVRFLWDRAEPYVK